MSDTTTLTEAAVLTGVGMAVVFAALILLMLAVVVLRRVMQGRRDSEEGNGAAPGATESVGPSKESIAAMALGLALLMEGSRVDPQVDQEAALQQSEPARVPGSGRAGTNRCGQDGR